MLLQWDLNNKNLHKRYVEICDEEFEVYFENIVQNILAFNKVKVLTISGPSSAGKTTTAYKLACNLKADGMDTKIISMDNFYKNREDYARRPDGTLDYETIDSLDTDFLIQCLNEAITLGKTKLPKYSFAEGKREPDLVDFELGDHEMVIMEGIHGLNPRIMDNLPIENVRSIYTTIDDKVFLPDEIVFSRRDIRLLRRLVRDYKYRGATPEYTFVLWDGVQQGEEKYIFPYENSAYIKINSFYKYELNVVKNQAMELLPHIKSDSDYYAKAQELLHKLSHVIAIDEEYVPSRSLIREFIGGSIYHNH